MSEFLAGTGGWIHMGRGCRFLEMDVQDGLEQLRRLWMDDSMIYDTRIERRWGQYVSISRSWQH